MNAETKCPRCDRSPCWCRPRSRTGATDREVEAVALICPHCDGKLWVDTRTEGSGYMSYEVPDAIACDGDCDAEWNTDGTVRTEPRWVRHPDLFSAPARAALLAEQPGGGR